MDALNWAAPSVNDQRMVSSSATSGKRPRLRGEVNAEL